MTVTSELAADDSVAVMVRLLVPALPSVILGFDGDRPMIAKGASSLVMVAIVWMPVAKLLKFAPEAEGSATIKLSLFS